ncbi:MAG: DUF1049 domain-containing protein [Gammaproteobacteria bacterium]|nr:MAG: DUF1049 domain-containing protein [Gammaproteobacteria bacterium]
MGILRSLIFLLLLLLMLALGVLIGIDNSDPVPLVFLDWQSPSLPVFLWVCGALTLGLLLGILLSSIGTLRQRRGRRQAERDLEATRRAMQAERQPGSS